MTRRPQNHIANLLPYRTAVLPGNTTFPSGKILARRAKSLTWDRRRTGRFGAPENLGKVSSYCNGFINANYQITITQKTGTGQSHTVFRNFPES